MRPLEGKTYRKAPVDKIIVIRAILASGIGRTPGEVLMKAGIKPVEMNGFIEEGLEAVYGGEDIRTLKARRVACTSGG